MDLGLRASGILLGRDAKWVTTLPLFAFPTLGFGLWTLDLALSRDAKYYPGVDHAKKIPKFVSLPRGHDLLHTERNLMNIHHLELFYYVARHGGIMEAVRNIPYGIQQPAVSGQVAQLEEYLGVTLFHRRPFSLTPEGEKLYQFILPFFSNLEKITSELQGGQERYIRIGASAIILREHLPSLVLGLRKKFPGLKISLREGYPVQLEQLLFKDEVDVAVTLLEKKTINGVHTKVLLELPMVLLVEKNSGLTSAEQLWKRDKIDEPLICLPPGEVLCKNFQQKLTELGVDWFPSLEASSADLIETYVANGLGIGVSVAIPQKTPAANVRVLPLPGFPPVVIGAMWRGRTTPLLQTVLSEMQARAQRLM